MVRQFGAPVVLRVFKGFPGILPKHTVGNKAVGIDRLFQSPLGQEAKSSRTAEWPSGTLLSLVVLSSDVSTGLQRPVWNVRSALDWISEVVGIACDSSSADGLLAFSSTVTTL